MQIQKHYLLFYRNQKKYPPSADKTLVTKPLKFSKIT